MNISKVSTPDVYRESADFRFFLEWFRLALSKLQYDTENLVDLYDPLRCPGNLLWMLGDTMGFKYDDRLPRAFNRLVLLYFMSMIRNRGSKDGITLAAEANLAQFSLLNYGKENEILYDRLEDTSIPVNSVYVTGHTEKGYIDVVYFSQETPIDACIEYVRPLGMYLFQYPGVRLDAKAKISVDARLTNTKELNVSIGPTHVGHYTRADYASMQRTPVEDFPRDPVYYRNKKYEETPDPEINPGYRALYSLQISNNEHIYRSLVGEQIFGLGYTPTYVDVYRGDNRLYDIDKVDTNKVWNLRYDKKQEADISADVYTLDDNRSYPYSHGKPVVNPIMQSVGDAISASADNTEYITSESGRPLRESVHESRGASIQDVNGDHSEYSGLTIDNVPDNPDEPTGGV